MSLSAKPLKRNEDNLKKILFKIKLKRIKIIK
jgi:hypothetical protein